MVHILNYIKKNRLLWPILLIGFIVHMAIIVMNGTWLCYHGQCGLYFFGVHSDDVIWHMALAGTSFQSWPFQNPTFSGATLSGYNYLIDLIAFLISKIGIPTMVIYFKLFPILWFVLFTASLIRFGLLLNKSPKFIGLLLFMSYFTGSWAYILTIWHNGSLFGSSGLVANQALHALANMQFAFSLVVILEVLIIIKKDILRFREAIILALAIFITVGLKFYGGIITSFIVGCFVISKLAPLNKSTVKTLGYGVLFLVTALLGVIIFYDPFSSTKTGAVFTFSPMATVHPTIESKELLYLPTLTNARYALEGKIGPRLVMIETLTLFCFLFFNYGIRLFGVGFILWKIAIKKIEKWEVITLMAVILATVLNILFIQKGEWWNTVQFLYYGLFFSTLFTAQFLFHLFEKKRVFFSVLAAVLIISCLPINIDLVDQFDSTKSMDFISPDEYAGLQFLKKQPAGIVYLPLYNEDITAEYSYPHPMFANYDAAYVTALTNKPAYFSSQTQLRLMGVDYKERLEKIRNADCSITKDFKYIYMVKQYATERFKVDHFFNECIINSNFTRVFANNAVWIYARQ